MTSIRVDRRGAIGRITLTRAEKQNAIDRETAELLFAGFQRLETDNQVRVVHLTGDGDDFCVGTDLDAMSRIAGEPPEVQRHDAESLGRVYLAIRALMKPVVCTVRGRALGAGAGLALACDVSLAHQDAEFGFPDVRLRTLAASPRPHPRKAVHRARVSCPHVKECP